jgi:uncharacterized protein HemX
LVDEDNALIAPVAPAVEPAAAEPGPPPKRKKARSMAWVGYLILLAVVALAVGGWFLLQELRSRQEGLGGQITNKDQQLLEVTRQLNAVQSEMASLHSQVATLQSQVSTDDSRFERMLGEHSTQLGERLETARTELGESVQRIQRQLNKDRGDLMVADAEYLLSIANQKLHLIGDVKSVLAAMEAADQRLHDSGDPAVFKVREALAEEIGALKSIDAPDVVGLSARILSLEHKVGDLPLFLPHAGAVQEHVEKDMARKPEPAPEGDDKAARDVLDSALTNIKDLVTVRRTNRPIEAVLTPQEAEGYREILLMKMETARIALLRADDQLYKDSLTSARDWLKEHFDPGAAEVREMETELNALLSASISVPLPDIGKSLSLLRNIEKLRLEAEEKEKGGGRKAAPTPAEPPAAKPEAAPAEIGPAPGGRP